MMQTVGRTAARGAAVAGAAAAGASVAQNQAAPPPLSSDQLQEAASLLKAEGVVVISKAEDGTEWLDTAAPALPPAQSDLASLIDLATEVAQDEAVQKVILAKARAQTAFHDSVRRLMGGPSDQPLGESIELVSAPEPTPEPSEPTKSDEDLFHSLVSDPSLVSWPATPSRSSADSLHAEMEELKRENARLRAQLSSSQGAEPTDAVATADTPELSEVLPVPQFTVEMAKASAAPAARVVSSTRGAPLAAGPPTVRVRLDADDDGLARLRVCVLEPHTKKPPRARHASRGAKGVTPHKLVVTAAIVVGLLAVVVSRNPAGAKVAAAAAAAVVASLVAAEAAQPA